MMTESEGGKTYAEIRAEYVEQHPASVPQMARVISDYPEWLRWMTFIMFVSAALLSGVHTVPTVYSGIESTVDETVRAIAGLSSFVAIELAIFVSAYARMRTKSRTALLILILAFSVAFIANIHSASKAFNVSGADRGSIIVTFAVGFGAPAIALMAGEMFVRMHSSTRRDQIEAERRHQDECKVFDDAIQQYWQDYQKREKRTGGRRAGASAAPSSSVQVDSRADTERTPNNGRGYTKNMDAATQMRVHLDNNPAHQVKSTRWLEDNVGIGSKSLWATIKKELPVIEHSSNGHFEDMQS